MAIVIHSSISLKYDHNGADSLHDFGELEFFYYFSGNNFTLSIFSGTSALLFIWKHSNHIYLLLCEY